MMKDDLRKEHFVLGSFSSTFHTTNQDMLTTDKNGKQQQNDKIENQKMKKIMRGHHFKLEAENKPMKGSVDQFRNSMTNMQFKKHDLNPIYDQQ